MRLSAGHGPVPTADAGVGDHTLRLNEGSVFMLANSDNTQAGEIVDKRRRLLVIVAVVAFVVAIGGLAAAQLIKSPAERAAEADAPPGSLITVPVELRPLVDTVIVRGEVTAAQSVDISTKNGNSGDSAVITATPVKPGDAVAAGRVLLEISGRPIFVLQGKVPAYRDLRPGSEGKDVEQLQRALTAIGLKPGADRSGAYGTGTRDAVAALYRRIGYPAPQAAGADGDKAAVPATAGAMLPASEVVYLGGFPGRVNAVNAQIGGPLKEKAVTVSAGALVVKGALAPHEKALVRVGMQVKLLSEVSGVEVAAQVTSVSESPTAPQGEDGQERATGRPYEMTVSPTTPLDPELTGENVRLTVEAAASEGDVLVVPLTAVSSGADGRTVVTIADPKGDKRRLEVRPGITGDGYVQVIPVGDGQLRPGERVVVVASGAKGGASGDEK